jgi:hypothetical protein
MFKTRLVFGTKGMTSNVKTKLVFETKGMTSNVKNKAGVWD